MSTNKQSNKKNLTPIFVSAIAGLVVIFFIALFLIQPSSNENYLGGDISVTGEELPDLSVDFNRDCVLFENLNYCQQLEPAAKMKSPIITAQIWMEIHYLQIMARLQFYSFLLIGVVIAKLR